MYDSNAVDVQSARLTLDASWVIISNPKPLLRSVLFGPKATSTPGTPHKGPIRTTAGINADSPCMGLRVTVGEGKKRPTTQNPN